MTMSDGTRLSRGSERSRTRTFQRFLISGATAALLFMALCYGFATLHLSPMVGSTLAYAIAFGFAYTMQQRWTFEAKHRHAEALPRYLVVQVLCAVLSGLISHVAVETFGLSPFLMAVVTTGIVGGASFLSCRYWVFRMPNAVPNKQYNMARPDSLPVKVATYQRRAMYALFLKDTGIAARDTLLDVGVTSDQTFSSSNYVEAWYPHKDRITACGLDDAFFLESLYPGMTFVPASGLDLPFEDGAFDVVHSSAVLEHVGSRAHQVQLIRESARVARKAIFLTTPNRWFPIEFHTVLPLVHWLPKPVFRGLMRATGPAFFAEESNLNLMTGRELRDAADEALRGTGFTPVVTRATLAGWPRNLLLIARR